MSDRDCECRIDPPTPCWRAIVDIHQPVGDLGVVLDQRIGEPKAGIVRQREAGAQAKPGRLVLERGLVEEVGAQRIKIEARRKIAAHEARFGEAEVELLAV